MKTFFASVFFFALTLACMAPSAKAQMIYESGAYYSQAGSVDCQCGPAYTVTVGYDYYGRPMNQAFQNCRERRWYSWQGGTYGYFWINGYWQSNYQVRTWWAFNWYDFQRRVW